MFDARRAEQLGIANRVVAADRLVEEAQRIALQVSQGALRAFAESNKLLNQWARPALETQLDLERQTMMECGAGPEAAEGMSVFMAKRPPQFGRARGEE